MSDSSPSRSGATTSEGDRPFANLGPEEMQAALFAQMVMQQANLALMLLGRTPHPETGQPVRDLDTAKLFIDQLEMLEAKTKGNLSAQESALLKQSLMTLRLAFVEEVNKPETPSTPPQSSAVPSGEAAPAAEKETASGIVTDAVDEDESKKRFSKKY